MDPEFPFPLPGETFLLALAYAADRAEVLKEFRAARKRGERFLAQRWATLFGLTVEDARTGRSYTLRLTCAGGCLGTARWLADHFALTAEDARAGDNLALRGACLGGQLTKSMLFVSSLAGYRALQTDHRGRSG